MRVFVAGASGAIGTRLVPQLIDRGHEVVGTYKSPEKEACLRALGAQPVALDLLDGPAVRNAIFDSKPDAIIHEATALANGGFSRKLDKPFAQTNRLRTEGTDNLLEAASDAGVHRFVAQSFAPYRYAREGGMVKTEDDPLDPAPPQGAHETNAAMAHVDQVVPAAGGIALRYGGFYGNSGDQVIRLIRKRWFPMIGDGAGVTSWVHLDDAAAATILAVEYDGAGIFNIVDDDPAPSSEWLPVLAQALGAKPPRHIPAGLLRIVLGQDVVMGQTQSRGASNARARRELRWEPRYPSWRQGFVAAFGSPAADR
jgi:nucleoside-diphosphate-sugar epimerase